MPNNIKKDLTLVVVSFNSGKVILDTLSELMEANTCSVIVVDNASTDDSRSLLRDRFPKVSYINLTVNIGYGRAANVALKNIDTDYAVLLNPDVLLSSAALNTIFNRAVRCQEKVAIFSPALKKADHSENGDIFVDYLIGAFLLFRMNALRKVGYFDENFFLFYEEKDLELRLIDNGYKLILQSDIYVEHLKSASTKSSKKIIFLRNWHVAWSNFFYSYKHNIMKYKMSGYLLIIKYGFKAILNKGDKKIKYKARFLGAIAYMKGEKSFLKNGCGQYADKLK